MCQERHGIFSIEVMVRGYHVYKSIWAATVGEEFEALAKNRYRAALATATAYGIGQRSRALENFACLNFCTFYFRIRDGANDIHEN
jgi:hypothetical protein